MNHDLCPMCEWCLRCYYSAQEIVAHGLACQDAGIRPSGPHGQLPMHVLAHLRKPPIYAEPTP